MQRPYFLASTRRVGLVDRRRFAISAVVEKGIQSTVCKSLC